MHKVVKRLTYKNVLVLPRPEKQFIAINDRSTSRRKMAALLEAVVTLFRRTGWINLRIGRNDHLHFCFRCGAVWIPAEVMICQHVMEEGMTIIHAEPIPPIVSLSAKLADAGNHFHSALVRFQPQIAPAQVH